MCITTNRLYMKLVMMPIEKIKRVESNPKSRTLENKGLARLKKSIATTGLIEPLTIASDGTLLNGHRRLACLIALGWTEVPCLIRELPAQKAWLEVSLHTRQITKGQILYAVHHGLDPANLPPEHQKMVEEAVASIDKDILEDMAEREASPFIVRVASLINTYTGDKSNEWRRTIIRWLVAHKQQKEVRWAMDSGIEPLVLADKIRRNLPLRWE